MDNPGQSDHLAAPTGRWWRWLRHPWLPLHLAGLALLLLSPSLRLGWQTTITSIGRC